MKKVFIYYTLSGNGDVVADYLSGKSVDIRKIKIEKAMPKKYFLQILTGGFLASINAKAKLVDFNNDISKYDEIIIGSPIWNDRLTPAINTVLEKVDLTNKKVTFILYSGSGKSKHAKEKIKNIVPNSTIIDLKEPKKNKEELKKIKNI